MLSTTQRNLLLLIIRIIVFKMKSIKDYNYLPADLPTVFVALISASVARMSSFYKISDLV